VINGKKREGTEVGSAYFGKGMSKNGYRKETEKKAYRFKIHLLRT
jgi:hypothetical protein